MIKQEAEAQAVILRAEMREIFGEPGEQKLGSGAGVIASAGAFEQAVKYSTAKPFYAYINLTRVWVRSQDQGLWQNLAYQKAPGLAVGQIPSTGSALGNFGYWKCSVAG